jgi:hypothetical protein
VGPAGIAHRADVAKAIFSGSGLAAAAAGAGADAAGAAAAAGGSSFLPQATRAALLAASASINARRVESVMDPPVNGWRDYPRMRRSASEWNSRW